MSPKSCSIIISIIITGCLSKQTEQEGLHESVLLPVGTKRTVPVVSREGETFDSALVEVGSTWKVFNQKKYYPFTILYFNLNSFPPLEDIDWKNIYVREQNNFLIIGKRSRKESFFGLKQTDDFVSDTLFNSNCVAKNCECSLNNVLGHNWYSINKNPFLSDSLGFDEFMITLLEKYTNTPCIQLYFDKRKGVTKIVRYKLKKGEYYI